MDSRKKYAKITSCSVPTILLQQTKARTYKCRKYTFTLNTKLFITFRVRHSRGEMYTGHGRLCVCMCVSVPRRIPTLLHGPECNLGVMAGVPSSCALLDGFAIRAWVSLLWQHTAEREMSASACTRSMPGYRLRIAWVVDDAKCILVMRVCVCVCVSVARRITAWTPDLTWQGLKWAGSQTRHTLICRVSTGSLWEVILLRTSSLKMLAKMRPDRLKMHQKAFGGGAPPDPLGEFPQTPSWV